MTDIFEGSTNPSIDPNTDYMAELVGDGKKFKTPADLARGKIAADRHIENLNKTLNDLRDELKTRKTTEDLMDRIAALSRTPEPQNQGTPPADDANKGTGLTKEEVERMFSERETISKQQSNLRSAQDKLIERYGDDTGTMIEQKSKELGVTKEHLKNMASQTPSVFLALFTEPSKTRDVFASPVDSRNLPGNTSLAGVKKFSEFQKMRKEDSVKYFSKEIQQELLRIGDKLGGPGNPRYDEWRAS